MSTIVLVYGRQITRRKMRQRTGRVIPVEKKSKIIFTDFCIFHTRNNGLILCPRDAPL